MYDPTSCEASRNATFSPESGSGPMHSDAQDGQTADPSGPAAVLASLSARQAKELGLLTSGTCGLTSIGSSSSAALQSSLESRLPEVLASAGSTLYRLTWKRATTPSGRSLLLQRASPLHTSDSGCTGWQTPRARGDAGGSRWRRLEAKNLEDQVRIFALLNGLTVSEVARLCVCPTFYRRLMGLPPEWDDSAVTAMQSLPRKPRRSSGR